MNVLILGATSAIAHEVAKSFAAQGATLFLVARDAEKLAAIVADLKVHGATRIETYQADLAVLDQHSVILEAAIAAIGNLDYALIAHGSLTDQARAQRDLAYTLSEFTVNGLSHISLMHHLANRFEQQRRGTICLISSPSADRGRGSTYTYGAARGAAQLYAAGLRNRLAKVGVQVVTVKPGYVDTPMTATMKKSPLFASAKDVGRRIHAAMIKGEDVLYVPAFWALIMLAIKNIPERIFKKLNL